jgi:hypothetical protein
MLGTKAAEQLEQIIKCLEDPSKHDLKYLTSIVKLGNIIIARAKRAADDDKAKEHSKEIEEMFKTHSEYLTTMMVVSALVLTISVPWLFTKLEKTEVYDDFYEDDALRILNSIMVILMMCSSMLSTMTIVIAMIFHVQLNIIMLTPEDRLWFISEHYVGILEVLIVASAVLLTLSIPFGIFVSYGIVVAYICTGIYVLSLLVLVGFAAILVFGVKRHLYPQYQQTAREFRAAKDRLLAAPATAAPVTAISNAAIAPM